MHSPRPLLKTIMRRLGLSFAGLILPIWVLAAAQIPKAEIVCAALLNPEARTFGPSAMEMPLPPDMMAVIQAWKSRAQQISFQKDFQDPNDSNLPEHQKVIVIGDGRDLVIGVSHLENDWQLGEAISAKFIAKVLRELYPRATLEKFKYSQINETGYFDRELEFKLRADAISNFKNLNPNKYLAYVPIRDNSETHIGRQNLTLEMKDIKPAIPGLAGLPPLSLRSAFGIPQDHMVLSLYFKHPQGNSSDNHQSPSMGEALGLINHTYQKMGLRPADVIFATEGGGTEILANEAFGGDHKHYNVIKLSDWFDKYDPARKTIVLNNLTGKMPNILNVANLAVVSGPINIMEPLTAGTPLLFFNNPVVIRATDYDPKTFNMMAEIALATGGAQRLSNIQDLGPAVQTTIRNPPRKIIPPYLVSSVGSKSAFENFLEQLLNIIQKSVQRAN